jgi:hypothetical protein
VKEPEAIARAVDALVDGCGYREITLSSLSSADYSGLVPLVRALNARYQDRSVSFALPSLKVEAVGLELFRELSKVRRSGLTFALETPECSHQRSINKEIPLDKTVAILREARRQGWRSAKFYFMVGLPASDGSGEADAIIKLLQHLRRESGMFLSVNVAAFIPKPHTPYQWARQLREEEALERIMHIKRSLPRSGFKIGYHSPFTSELEGIVARGDERVSEFILAAYRAGARLDAWEDRIQWDVWRNTIKEARWPVLQETLRARSFEEPLPWDAIGLGVSRRFLQSEWERSVSSELTRPCDTSCDRPCGICRPGLRARTRPEGILRDAVAASPDMATSPDTVVFEFEKKGRSVFLSHLDVMQTFERALIRAGYQAEFTRGQNPKPRMEFASPLTLGVTSFAELAQVGLRHLDGPENFLGKMNTVLPEGLQITRAAGRIVAEGKRRSLASLFWGADFVFQGRPDLLDRLESHLGSERMRDVTVSAVRSASTISVRIRNVSRGGTSISAIMKEVLAPDERPLLEVSRVAMLAEVGGQPADFFETVTLPA